MGFDFAFQTLYRLRQSVEHQQELRLRAANHQVAKVRHAIDQIHKQLQQLQNVSAHHLDAGMTSAEIRFALRAMDSLTARDHDLQRILSHASTIRDQQEKIFRQARRERETLEILREQQLKEFKRLQIRREQRTLDDLFLLRRTCLKRG